ncbi:MAG: sodium:solute symporter family protein [Alphaproteobacteria bacterium]|nr:sodium:solute symporter family protein [Alphaproteobacteria bacterium]
MGDVGIIISITGAYFLLVLAAIMYTRIRDTGKIMPGLSEFFLASRDVHVAILICTFIGSLFSASFALALPTFVFKHGLGGCLYAIAGDMVGILFMVTLYKALRAYSVKHDLYSPMECLSKAYNSPWVGFTCALLMIIFLSPYISMQLVGIGKFLEGFSGGEIGYITGVGGMMSVVALYLIFGGMRAVAYTDFVQTIAIFLGVFGSVALFTYMNWGSVSGLMEAALETKPHHLSVPGPEGYYDWPLFLSISILTLGLVFQPQLLTRGLMARDDRQINAMGFGLFIGLLLGTIPVFLFGLGGAVLYGDSVEPNQVMGVIFQDVYNHSLFGLIVTGLMLVGALGAAMSTADSILLAIGQIFTRDVASPFFELSQKSQVLLSKVIMMIVLGGAFLIGLRPPELMGDLVVYSASATCILVPVFVGFQWKKRSDKAALLTLAVGVITLATLAITKTQPMGLQEGFLTLLVTIPTYWLSSVILYKRASQTA